MASCGCGASQMPSVDTVAAAAASSPKCKMIEVAVPKTLKTVRKLVRTPLDLSPSSSAKGAASAATGLIPEGYGYVVLTAIGSVMLITWKAIKVGQAREIFQIPYPVMYDDKCMEFNCIQRAHQNTLENYPQFLVLLMMGGLEYPKLCSVGGWIWIFGRICYAKGYYTGDPKKRARGTFGIAGMIVLFVASVRFAFRHIGLF